MLVTLIYRDSNMKEGKVVVKNHPHDMTYEIPIHNQIKFIYWQLIWSFHLCSLPIPLDIPLPTPINPCGIFVIIQVLNKHIMLLELRTHNIKALSFTLLISSKGNQKCVSRFACVPI